MPCVTDGQLLKEVTLEGKVKILSTMLFFVGQKLCLRFVKRYSGQKVEVNENLGGEKTSFAINPQNRCCKCLFYALSFWD